MSIVNAQSGTRIDEIARAIYRISTPVLPGPGVPGGFSFNQILIAADAPLLFHTGPRRLFPLVHLAVSRVLDPGKLRYIGFSHCEGDETGSLREWLDAAPHAQALCGKIAAMVFASDAHARPVHAMAHGEPLDLGGHEVTWFDAPHVPHGWDCGFLGELTTRALLCGDLFTQAGADNAPLTHDDILGPSEAMRAQLDYFAHGPNTATVLEQLAGFEPRLLACMHGSCFAGDGRKALQGLAAALRPTGQPAA
jgi:flavorubredoxin